MKKLSILLLILGITIPVFSQGSRVLERYPRDQRYALNILPELGGWKYAGTGTITVDSASIDSTSFYFDYSDFDSSVYRTNIQLLASLTGGAAANYQPLYGYYKLINYAGTASADSFWINDMISEWWSNSKVYVISLPPAPAPAKGIKCFIVNTGIATITASVEIWTGEAGMFSNSFETYSMADTINSDTTSGVFPVINLNGLHSIIVTLDSINCDSDSIKFEIRPAWTYTGAPANTPWIELDSLKWRDWTDGYTRLESIDGYLPPCPFIEWQVYSGAVAGDTVGVTIQYGGYRK